MKWCGKRAFRNPSVADVRRLPVSALVKVAQTAAIGLTLATVVVGSLTHVALVLNVAIIVLSWPSAKALIRAIGGWRWAWAGLFVLSVASTFYTPLPAVSSIQVERLWLGMSAAMLAAQLSVSTCGDDRWMRAVFSAGIAITAGLATVAPLIVDTTTATGIAGRLLSSPAFVRVTVEVRDLLSDSVNPNVLGGALAILLPIMFSAATHPAGSDLSLKIRFSSRIVYAICVMMLVLALAFANSRGAMIAAAGGVGYLVWRRSPRKTIVLALLCTMVAAVVLFTEGLFQQFTAIWSYTFGGKEGFAFRLEIWQRALYVIRDFPFTGLGMGAFENVVQLLYPLILNQGRVPHAHNLWLQIAVDLGVPALLCWCALMTQNLLSLRHVAGANSDRVLMVALAEGLMGANIAIGMHGMIDAVTWGMVRLAPVVWVLWGLAIGLRYTRSGCCAKSPVITDTQVTRG